MFIIIIINLAYIRIIRPSCALTDFRRWRGEHLHACTQTILVYLCSLQQL